MSAKHPKRNERAEVDRAGRTPLHYAAADGDAGRVSHLLDSGSDPCISDDDGWTPLHFAAQSGSPPVISLLLDAGATVDSRDVHGNTPLLKAVFNSRGKGEAINLLRSRGADPFLQNKHGVSPVKLARTIANYDVSRFFNDLPGEAGT